MAHFEYRGRRLTKGDGIALNSGERVDLFLCLGPYLKVKVEPQGGSNAVRIHEMTKGGQEMRRHFYVIGQIVGKQVEIHARLDYNGPDYTEPVRVEIVSASKELYRRY